MVNYALGKIYQLVSSKTNDIYIGSTCQSLSERFAQHKYKPTSSSYMIMQFDDAKIVLIEDFPCERKEQLLQREYHHIKENTENIINLLAPIRSEKQRQQDNKEKIREQKKIYCKNNADKIKLYPSNSLEYMHKHNQDYYKNNKEYLCSKYTCSCGKTLSISGKSAHEKTLKHKEANTII